MPKSEGGSVVQALFPGRTVAPEGEGQLSTAWRIDDELVVRVPKHTLGIEQLRFEVRLLESIGPRLGGSAAVVPEIVDVQLDLPVGRAYVAHRRIPGRILSRDDVAAATPSRVRAIGEQVGRFLRDLHAIDGSGLVDVPVLTPGQFAAALAGEVDTLLRPRLGDDQATALERSITDLASLPTEPAVLAHTDIGGNVVVDAYDRIGVIDFGGCLVTHPAFDVASLSVLGDELVQAAAAVYPLLGTVTREAAIVAETFFLQDVLYGARQEDWAYVEALVAARS